MLVIPQGLVYIGAAFILMQILVFVFVTCILIVQVTRRRRHVKRFKKELKKRRAAIENGSLQRTGHHSKKPVTGSAMDGSWEWIKAE